MNEQFHNYIKKSGENITLSPAERERMRGVLHAYMEMKPIRANQSVAQLVQRSWFFTLRPVAAVLVLALFISSAGISYAASDALPGDMLYAVKTHINEPVQGALAVSASAKATWATDVAGKRVEEAATLAAEGRLSSSTQQELQSNFEAHAQEATAAIQSQASSTPDQGVEAAVRFEAQLSEYENVLSQVAAAKNVDVASLVSSVKNEGGRIAMVRARAESGVALTGAGSSVSASMHAAARQQLTDSSELAHANTGSLSASSANLVAVQLQSASTTISTGEEFAARKSIPDALGAFQSALSAAEKLGVFLQTSSAIHARTGMVVGEPGATTTPQGGQPVNKSNGRPYKNGVHAGLMAASTFSSSSTPQTTSSDAASTSTDDDKRTGSDDSVSARSEDGQEVTAPNVPTLPVSVPTHLSL